MKNINRFKIIGLFISGLIILASCAILSIERLNPLPLLENQAEQPVLDSGMLADFASNESLISLYESVNPGVVAIIVYNDGVVVGQGSGFLFDDQGHILTNFHVVENAAQIEVIFPSGLDVYGELIGSDLDSDIAVIKTDISEVDVKPLILGNSANVKVGQYVVAIGNPYGLSGTMTVGIVSARGRLLDSLRAAPSGGFFTAPDLIQTDAAINPGNSGGPLLNMNGEVIGINRAIRTNEGGDGVLSNSGIGFAIPIDIVKRVIPYLIRDGKYEYPYLGIISRQNLTLVEKEVLGFSVENQGAYVIDVPENGPAADAGLRGGTEETIIVDLQAGGDLIMAVDGESIRNFSDLLAYLVTYKSPGDEMKITVLRDGQELEIKVVLEKRPR
jgi:S1-C subfamily serine protease